MKADEFTIVELKQTRKQTAKTRNPVAKNLGVTASGAGAHKDKKRDAKTGVEKHKKDYAVENSHLGEISKKTLGSYVKKSAFDAAKKGVQLGGSTKQDTSSEQGAILKRQRGISRATDRLVRKEDMAENDRSEMDTPEFQRALASVKKQAAQGPMTTVYDPKTRKYKVVPVNTQGK